jgi:U3 small nucleolar RNA-associated protein 23
LLADASRFKMDLVKGLEQTLSGKVKVLVTQCSMRHLYGSKGEPGVEQAIELGKKFERRRCGHHPDQYPEPLSTLECLSSVVDPKSAGVNKHRYVVACNDQETRAALRLVKGTPLLYISRSVMIMEPMADESVQQRAADERAKLKAEIKRFNHEGKKRKRDNDNAAEDGEEAAGENSQQAGDDKKAKKKKGPKGPNPLSVKKAKKKEPAQEKPKPDTAAPGDAAVKDGPKRKRRKKNKAPADEAGGPEAPVADAPAVAAAEGGDSD